MRSGLPVFNIYKAANLWDTRLSAKDALRQRCTTRTETMTKREIVEGDRESFKVLERFSHIKSRKISQDLI